MIISDFNLLCLGSAKIENLNLDEINYKVFKNYSRTDNAYGNNWQVMNAFKGMWYSFYPKARELGDYNNEFFDLETRMNPYSRKEEYFLICEERFKTGILKLINYFIESSPIQRICILFRIENKETSKICCYKERNFIKNLCLGKLKFNTIYFIGR